MKFAAKLLLTLIILLMLAISSVAILLQTKYAEPVINQLLGKYADNSVHIGQVDYDIQSPLYVHMKDITIKQAKSAPLHIERLELWIAPRFIQDSKLQLKSLLVDGMSLQQGKPALALYDWIQINQLSINNLDYADNELVLREASVQFESGVDMSQSSLQFSGKFQFSAKQLYWHGEALNNLLINGHYAPNLTTLYGLSFTWQQSEITAQAELIDSKIWKVPSLTISHLNLESDSFQQATQYLMHITEQDYQFQLERIDLLNSNIELPEFSANQLNLTAQNIDLNRSFWQQQSEWTFSADSIQLNQQLIESPIVQFSIRDNRAEVEHASLQIFNGSIQFTGQVSPTTVNLESLNISHLKWIVDTDIKNKVSAYINGLSQLDIAQLSIKNSKIINANDPHPFQITSLEMEGKGLELQQNDQWGLWSGNISMSASSASIDYLTTEQPLVKMNSMGGEWIIERAVFPFAAGLLDITGNVDLHSDSQPWSLSAIGDGVPINVISQWIDPELSISGDAELNLSAKGLIANRTAFNYSLEGRLILVPRNVLSSMDGQQLWQRQLKIHTDKEQGGGPFALDSSAIEVSADRGRVTVSPVDVSGDDFILHLEGDYDLVSPQKSSLSYQFSQECQQINRAVNVQEMEIINSCDTSKE
ncbi:AsmA family protein [Aliivibrio kagoshimensis]|uniref:AsmA family protein n=1 Tax=Aliivibrio kagoshimensis TaxID=2910230 RepID=UPI003D1232B5